MNEYHKIQTVYKRDPETNYKTLIDGDWALPEFGVLKGIPWVFTEKIDGTNIRVMWDGEKVSFGGKTDQAQIPSHLVMRLIGTFTTEKMAAQFGEEPTKACLYGEGYGVKIQKGGKYIPDGVDFILFDVNIGGAWLRAESVGDISNGLGIGCVPVIGSGPLVEAVEMARGGIDSLIGDCQAEGLVMRPVVELQTRMGKRIIAKIKTKDFLVSP